MKTYIKAAGLCSAWLLLMCAYFWLLAWLPKWPSAIVAVTPMVGIIFYACLLHVRQKQATP